MGEKVRLIVNRLFGPAKAGRYVLPAVAVLLAWSQAGPLAQGAKPPQIATDITAADIQTVIKAPTGGGDRQMKVVDMGKYNVSVGVLRRGPTKPGAPVGAINHEHVTEVYYIVSGSGTLLTGGVVEGAKPLPADGEIVKIAVGPSNQGVFKQAAQTRKVSTGDMIIIPPGVYHGFTDVTDHVEYVSVRPDPDHVLPAGYVHPLLKK
jgi:mannose-6-phosphate isomerase-like protein (cupin superfamily)